MKISASCANKDETPKTNIVEFQVPTGTSMEFFGELAKKRMARGGHVPYESHWQIIFGDTDLRIYWEKGESSCGALQTIAGAVLDIGEACSGTLVYEVPAQIQNFAIILCNGEPVYPKASIIGFSVGE